MSEGRRGGGGGVALGIASIDRGRRLASDGFVDDAAAAAASPPTPPHRRENARRERRTLEPDGVYRLEVDVRGLSDVVQKRRFPLQSLLRRRRGGDELQLLRERRRHLARGDDERRVRSLATPSIGPRAIRRGRGGSRERALARALSPAAACVRPRHCRPRRRHLPPAPSTFASDRRAPLAPSPRDEKRCHPKPFRPSRSRQRPRRRRQDVRLVQKGIHRHRELGSLDARHGASRVVVATARASRLALFRPFDLFSLSLILPRGRALAARRSRRLSIFDRAPPLTVPSPPSTRFVRLACGPWRSAWSTTSITSTTRTARLRTPRPRAATRRRRPRRPRRRGDVAAMKKAVAPPAPAPAAAK